MKLLEILDDGIMSGYFMIKEFTPAIVIGTLGIVRNVNYLVYLSAFYVIYVGLRRIIKRKEDKTENADAI